MKLEIKRPGENYPLSRIRANIHRRAIPVIKTLRRVELIFLAVFLFPCPLLFGQSMSFSTDFDGRGTGTGFKVTVNRPTSGPRPASGNRPSPVPDVAHVQQYLDTRYQEQLLEATRAAEAERIRKQIEEDARNRVATLSTLLDQLEQLENNEPSVIERMKYTQQVLTLQRQFESARTAYLATLPTYRQRLAASIDNIHVPPPRVPLHYKRILIWGMFRTPAEAQKAAVAGEKDPFSGQPFDDVFAFGESGVTDAGRVGLDHLLGRFQKLSATTRAQISRLKGATADEVVCHSNGCRIAEVLIATGMLKVGKLRILGGDNSALDLDYLKTLKQTKGLSEVSVYMLKGDPVPVINPGWEIMDQMKKIGGPLQTFNSYAADTTYQLLGLTKKPGFDPSAEVKVHIMSYPGSSVGNVVAQHAYENYSRVLKGWRLSGCLETEGSIDRRCIIY